MGGCFAAQGAAAVENVVENVVVALHSEGGEAYIYIYIYIYILCVYIHI